MWNVAENGDVECGGERWCWNLVDSVDVGLWRGTVM